MRVEREQLEQADDTIRQLKEMVAKLRLEVDGLQIRSRLHIAARTIRERELRDGQRWLSGAEERIKVAEADGRLSAAPNPSLRRWPPNWLDNR